MRPLREGEQVGDEEKDGDEQPIDDAFDSHGAEDLAHARLPLADDIVGADELAQPERECQDGHEPDRGDDHQPGKGNPHADRS
jgi:hypothetical protein